ncbi:unnamed protein product, partial [Ixodes hexagonus]
LSQWAVSESLSSALLSSLSWSQSFMTPCASSTFPSQPNCSTCCKSPWMRSLSTITRSSVAGVADGVRILSERVWQLLRDSLWRALRMRFSTSDSIDWQNCRKPSS